MQTMARDYLDETDPFLPSAPDVKAMVAEARGEGFAFVDRAMVEWESRVNRFDRAGECFLQLRAGDRIAAIGGLCRDPYVDDPLVGRIRHVYVRPAYRRAGVGRALVRELLGRASHFTCLRLRATNEQASLFYESLEFVPVKNPSASHVMLMP